MKKITALFLAVVMLLSITACGTAATSAASDASDAAVSAADSGAVSTGDEASEPAAESAEAAAPVEESAEVNEGTEVNIAVLAGPTGIGAVSLMEGSDNGETVNTYNFTIASENSEVTAGLTNGSFDIAAVATNVAANLYNKTGGAIRICALNTYGVLYILENGTSVNSIQDLVGRTIYAVGQGANPEYVLEYILTRNGLTWSADGSDADVQIEFMDSETLTAGMASGMYDLCMLPVPAVTSVEVQNSDVRTALNLTDEWNTVAEDGSLTMGCIVVRTEFAEQHPEAVAAFLTEYAASIASVTGDVSHASELCESYGIVPKAAIAAKAIPDCNLCCVTGADIQSVIEPYYQVLFNANPDSIGGAVPDEAFYYIASE